MYWRPIFLLIHKDSISLIGINNSDSEDKFFRFSNSELKADEDKPSHIREIGKCKITWFDFFCLICIKITLF